jgi:hypothetical protein
MISPAGGWPQIVVPGVILLVGLAAMFDFKPRGLTKHIHHKEQRAETSPVASSGATVIRSDRSLEWIPFHKALHYLVYDSDWGANQPTVSGEEEFNTVVCAELRERLARGEIAARGWRGWDDEKSVPRATEAIQPEFWVDAYFRPWGEIALAKDNQGIACKRDGGGEQWRGIILRDDDVRKVWPPRQVLPGAATEPTRLAAAVEGTRFLCAQGTEEEAARIAAQQQTLDIVRALNDERDEQDKLTQLRLGALLSPSRAADVQAGRYRNVSLAEALGWAVYGEWGRPYHVSGVRTFIGVGTDPDKLLARFTRLARDGSLTIWGKRDDPGYFEKIPQPHWQGNQLTIADIFGSVVATGEDPYRDLMLNRAEVEREWPHDG